MSKHAEEISAHRALLNASPGKHLYAVTMNGEIKGHIEASNLPQARGWARKLAQRAFDSRWNQSLIFNGDQREGEISPTQFRCAIRHFNERGE